MDSMTFGKLLKCFDLSPVLSLTIVILLKRPDWDNYKKRHQWGSSSWSFADFDFFFFQEWLKNIFQWLQTLSLLC